jgi:hypothetical protein
MKGDRLEDTIYDNYIAIDWAATNMAIARMTKKSNKITAIDVPANIKELRFYLKNLKGTKILAFEETTTSQWLYACSGTCGGRPVLFYIPRSPRAKGLPRRLRALRGLHIEEKPLRLARPIMGPLCNQGQGARQPGPWGRPAASA